MNYLSVKETAAQWGVSTALVRRYCKEGRIPKAVLKETGWLIPANARRPGSEVVVVEKKTELPPLARKLQNQKKKKNYHGLYDYVQVNLTYSSNRMASNRLTRQQVDSVFRKGKVSEMFEPVKVSDLIEVMNHCICVDYVLDHVGEPLSPRFLKGIHEMLTYGTVDGRLGRVQPGEYRSVVSGRKEPFIAVHSGIANAVKSLIAKYESDPKKELEDLLNFHVRLERIFPFEDYNGRVGRLILFKECLRHGVMPFILDDKRRGAYLEGLRKWDEDRTVLLAVAGEAQARFEHQIDQHILLAQGKRFAPKDSEYENEE